MPEAPPEPPSIEQRLADIPGRNPLDEDLLDSIMEAPGPRVKLKPQAKRELADAIEKVAWFTGLSWHITSKKWAPARTAKETRAVITSLETAIERSVELLTDDRGVPQMDFIARAGFEAERADPDEYQAISGIERARNCVEEMQWLQKQLRLWEKRTRKSVSGTPGRAARRSMRLEATRLLLHVYEKAYGRAPGISSGGPATRFLRAFFVGCGDVISNDTIASLIRDTQRTK